MMATSFYDPDGKPISSEEFIQKLFGDLSKHFKNEDELIEIWSQPDTRKALLESLSEAGYGMQQLNEVRQIIDAENCIATPGLIDSHTHPIFIGNRANEFIMRLNGKSYDEIKYAGGGILSSIKNVNKIYKEIRRQQFVILILRTLIGIRINKYFCLYNKYSAFNGRSVNF